ncbi:hypothetical protein F6B41_07850 [Microbacterium lushaniae]|nr:hypothetical protein F6B41_28690 [Microbacterium lushaniae]KAA9156484.1 hypothetical protein F6B41_07850 [Microbacterium lushaniae]
MIALALSACQFADDGARLFGRFITKSTPIVESLPLRPDDATLARSAVQHLSQVDQSLLSRARDLAQDEDVRAIVSYSCNLSGLASADPEDVVDTLRSVAEDAVDQDGLELLYNDASATAENVQSETGASGVMTVSASLAVAVFQQVYC